MWGEDKKTKHKESSRLLRKNTKTLPILSTGSYLSHMKSIPLPLTGPGSSISPFGLEGGVVLRRAGAAYTEIQHVVL